MKKEIEIVIVDDHQVMREGISSLLEANRDFRMLGMASNGKEALVMIKQERPQVVVLDVNMPEMDGFELAGKVRKDAPYAKMLVLSMHADSLTISRMVSTGVRGYLSKNCPKEELYSAIRSIAQGRTWFNDTIREAVFSERQLEKERAQDLPITPAPDLTQRELEILSLIADELTQDEIAEKLFISPHTVIYHRRKLLAKFGVRNTAGLIRKAIGYKLIE